MLNQIVLVGRLTRDPELRTTDNGTEVVNITMAVDRTFKNSSGEYETDFIDIILWKAIAVNTHKYCSKGDLIGVKGRLQARNYKDDTGTKKYKTEVVAEKVTFLSTERGE